MTTIEDYNKRMKQPTLHPLMAVIDPARLARDEAYDFCGNFYAVRFKHAICGEAAYGRQRGDFQYGTVVFTPPGKPVRLTRADTVQEGISGILFHPDVFSIKSLIFKKTDYTFFSYRENESLHVSLQERDILQDCLVRLGRELRTCVDRHSLRLLAVHLELLLDYCRRFYERQFIVRTNANQQILSQLSAAAHTYLGQSGHKSAEAGTDYLRQSVPNLSPAYLNDLVLAETGKTIGEYLRLQMVVHIKKEIREKSRPLEDIAAEFGLQYPRSFNLLFKQEAGCWPEECTASVRCKPS